MVQRCYVIDTLMGLVARFDGDGARFGGNTIEGRNSSLKGPRMKYLLDGKMSSRILEGRFTGF